METWYAINVRTETRPVESQLLICVAESAFWNTTNPLLQLCIAVDHGSGGLTMFSGSFSVLPDFRIDEALIRYQASPAVLGAQYETIAAGKPKLRLVHFAQTGFFQHMDKAPCLCEC